MKKIYLLSISLFTAVCSLTAQTAIEVKNTSGMNEVLSNNAIVYKGTTANNQTAHDFEIKNISSNTVTFIVRRYDDLLNTVVASSDQAYGLFCTDLNCFPPTTYTASVVLAPNATFELITYLNEASIVGESSVRYKVYDQNNPTDEFIVNLKYNNIMSVKANASLFSNVSDVFPNPSVSNANLNISVANATNNVKISIINTLGTVVSTKTVDLTSGKNTIGLDLDNLSSGIYFVTIGQGPSKVTKKITISK